MDYLCYHSYSDHNDPNPSGKSYMIYYFNSKNKEVSIKTNDEEVIILPPKRGTVVPLALGPNDVPMIEEKDDHVFISAIDIDSADASDYYPLF